MRESDLLFPSITGGFRTGSCLKKPFDAACKELKLNKKLTARGMRRTLQDLARQRQVKDIVTRAISGHATEAMQHHYSTVAPEEIQKGPRRHRVDHRTETGLEGSVMDQVVCMVVCMPRNRLEKARRCRMTR